MTEAEIDEQIADFVQHRAEIKRPMNETAIKRLRQRAIRYNELGADLMECFDKAITSGWQSIYYKPEEKVKEMRPASFAEYKGPDYGERTAPETARTNIANIRQMVRK